MDVLGTSDLDDTVSWFENLGDGSFSSENVLSENVDGACSVYSDDLDNDGDMDIVSASAFDGKIAWYENLGDGNFSDEMIVSTNGKNVISVHSTDLDGDGDMDVLTSTENTHKIAWYENLGDGIFSPQRVISRNAKGRNSVFSDDLDGDGDMDVLSTSFDDNKIVWYENLGNGNLSDEIIISTNTGGACSVYTEDLDGDGDMDILSAAYLGDRVEWHENLGNGNFSDRIVISDNADGVCSVYSEDLDEDGDMDVLSASPNDDKIAWYENLGEGNFSSQIIISANAGAPASVYSADLDQDGDMDVLSASLSDDKVVWYENLGDGIFSDELILSNNAERATSVYSEDLDGDGDMDVMSASFSDSKIAWYENLGNGVFSSELILSTTQNWAEQVLSADMDGDGDMDVLSVGSGQGQVTWFENLAGEGCINPDACNFNPDAFIENGTCCLGVCGCMDIYSANYNQDAVCDNGSCIFGISGIVFYDENENGEFDEVDEEYPLANQEIVIQPLDWTTFTNDEGEFTLNDIPAGNYDVSLVNTDLFPFSTTSNPLSISVGQESSEVMMGVSNELPQADLSVTFYNGNGIGYPCDDWVYHDVCFMNEGNFAMDGIVEVELDSLFQDYSEFTPIDSVVGNTIYMSFENLLPGQSYCPFFDLLTPNADFFGETISSTARVYGMLDGAQVAYGEDELNVLMTCAYDPNDKQVFPNGYEEPHFVLNETELEYLIRFQNTGNAFATNVLVTDTIDENLNLETFSLVSNSHSVQTSIKPEERVIEFLFENIMLPDSGANEPESHGLISFMISPYEGLIPGTELNNTGNIFFDNNPPIITNTTWSTIYECTNALANVQDYNDVICPHAEIQLENNNQFIENYLWTSGGVSIGTESILIGSLQPGYSEIQLVVSNPICEASTSIPFQLLDSPEIITSEDQSICVGEEVTISAESEFDLVWAELIGGNEHTLSPEETSVYSVSTSSPDFECETISLITITVIPYPDAQFSANGIVLTANAGDAYQWFINSEPIEGATDQTLTIEEDGNYSVEVTNEWDCSTTSEEQFITYVGIDGAAEPTPLQIFPNPANQDVNINLPFNSGSAQLIDSNGKLVKSFLINSQVVNLSVEALAEGMYHLTVISSNGVVRSGKLMVAK